MTNPTFDLSQPVPPDPFPPVDPPPGPAPDPGPVPAPDPAPPIPDPQPI